jgi:hypothetical protein
VFMRKIGAYAPRKTPLPSVSFSTDLNIRIKIKDYVSGRQIYFLWFN